MRKTVEINVIDIVRLCAGKYVDYLEGNDIIQVMQSL